MRWGTHRERGWKVQVAQGFPERRWVECAICVGYPEGRLVDAAVALASCVGHEALRVEMGGRCSCIGAPEARRVNAAVARGEAGQIVMRCCSAVPCMPL